MEEQRTKDYPSLRMRDSTPKKEAIFTNEELLTAINMILGYYFKISKKAIYGQLGRPDSIIGLVLGELLYEVARRAKGKEEKNHG